MGDILEGVKHLSWIDILFAAASAYLITWLLLRFKRMKDILCGNQELSMDFKGLDIGAVIHRCQSLFPIETIYFHGCVFTRGTLIRITTVQKKVFEGQLIGRNDSNIICLMTKQHIIAHEINKIEEIVKIVEWKA